MISHRLRPLGASTSLFVATALSLATAHAAGGRPEIEISVIGTAADLERVQSLLPPRDIVWSHQTTFDPRDLLRPTSTLRAFIDLRAATRARLYFSAPSPSSSSASPDRYLLRDVPLSGHFDELDCAALTEVIELSIAALLDDHPAGLTRQETEALVSPPAPPAPKRSSPLAAAPALLEHRYRLGLGAFYAAQAQTAGAPIAHGPALLLFASRHVAVPSLAPWLSAQYRLTERVRSDAVGVDLDTIALRVGAELRWGGLAAPFGLRLGTGADLVRISPRAAAPDVIATGERWTTDLVFTAALRAGLRLDGRTVISVLLLADLLPAAVRYDVETAGRLATVFAPWRVRPGLAVEVSFR